MSIECKMLNKPIQILLKLSFFWNYFCLYLKWFCFTIAAILDVEFCYC